MTDVLVETRRLGKDFPAADGSLFNVLCDVDCHIREGENIALVGPSGSGKSTLLHVLGGLTSPTRGEIAWPALGKREALQPEKIAFVFQAPSLFPALTVVQNVMLPLMLVGGVADAHDRAMSLLAQLELRELAQNMPDEISGGQAQRVSMARALVVRPRLLLADEPTGQLDTATSTHLFDMVLDLIQGSGVALVVATHDLAVADRMACRWPIDHGRLLPGTEREASRP
ncbi:ABC transporter ATP-binding protein [Rhizobiaceae sp. 2RAB30]